VEIQFLASALLVCSSLRSICIPSSIETIADNCLFACANLSHLTFESTCQALILSECAFEGASLRSICLPSSIQTISELCFKHCANLMNPVLESEAQLSDESLQQLRSKYDVTLKCGFTFCCCAWTRTRPWLAESPRLDEPTIVSIKSMHSSDK
jgi:hypothetical protein